MNTQLACLVSACLQRQKESIKSSMSQVFCVKDEPAVPRNSSVVKGIAQASLHTEHDMKHEPEEAEKRKECVVSEASARAGLYADHVVKDELVLGPERLQPRDVSFALQVASEQTLLMSGCKQEPVLEHNCSGEQPVLTDCAVSPERCADLETENGSRAGAGAPACGQQPVPPLQPSRTTVTLHECPTCHKQFKRWDHLDRHLPIHTAARPRQPLKRGPRECHFCHKQFKYTRNFKKHIRKHTGGKPYTCGTCNKQFNIHHKLYRHMRIHTAPRPRQPRQRAKNLLPRVCDICHKQFNYSNDLKKHMRTHTKEQPFSCITCNKRFTLSCNLKTHERIHTGEKMHSCEICKKKFTHIVNLNKHRLIHTGEKPFSCKICNKQFRQSSNLKRHEAVHTREKLLSCRICRKIFKELSHLKVHVHCPKAPKAEDLNQCSKGIQTFEMIDSKN